MSECSQPEQCGAQFEAIHQKLDRLDDAIRGNGRLGILTRLDRLEQGRVRASRVFWLALGAGAAGLVQLVIAAIGG